MSSQQLPLVAGGGAQQQQQKPAAADQRSKKDDQRDGDLSSFIDEILKGPMDPLKTLACGNDSLEYLSTKAAPEAFKSMENFKLKLPELVKLNDESSLQWKQQGNVEFSSKHHDLAVMHYTRGMMHVASKDMLSTLLNNRSTVLYSQRRYRDAAIDAHKALELKTDYFKCHERRAACLKELGFAALAEKDAAAVEAQDQTLAADAAEVCAALDISDRGDNTPPPLAPEAKTFSTDVVQMAATDGKGRHLVAAQKLKAGTSVLVETPFAAAPLIDGMNVSCCHCFKRTSLLFPCRRHMEIGTRSRGLFCSELCAAEYWIAYGELESKNPFYLVCPVDTLLALRLMRQANVVKMPEDFDNEKFKGENIPPEFACKFGSHYALTMMNFSSELYPSATVGGKETLMTSIALFFGAVEPLGCDGLLKAHRQVLVNAYTIKCSDRIINPAHPEQHSVVNMRLGKSIYLVGTLFNHSCDPNCAIHTKGEPFAASAEIHIQLTRTVMEGEELHVCYEGINKNTNHSTRARIRALRSQYGFNCICRACSNNVDDAVSKEDQEHYIKAADLYQKGRRLCREGKFEDSVATLGHSLDLVLEKICPPPRQPQLMVSKTHDAMAQSYQLLGNKEKCIFHLLESVEVLKIHHGDDDEALHREYVKLAMLYKDTANTEAHLRYSNMAKELLELHYPPSEHLKAEVSFLLGTAADKK